LYVFSFLIIVEASFVISNIVSECSMCCREECMFYKC
jgi:hypothetical protein